ncbi:type III polyketide synthase [Larkinella rosea]|uniref:Type III polyketide synthase n=1 Tax=Larkinella rosea TaxID=2025312 RepID=A0A3P1BSU5_9BACT|nr:type III polyketide synthase [Larkinella rosea]RRB03993.1 type III polyketide synthase [Larkinella rosea]
MNPARSYMNAIGTAVPAYAHDQNRIAQFMAETLQLDKADRRRLMALFSHTKIDTRYSVLPDYSRPNGQFTFYPNTLDPKPFPTVGQRMEIYRREAVPLALQAIRACLADYPEFSLQSLTHLVVVSCTGFYAPGPDIDLVEALGLPGTTQRLLIGFMGCYGALNGLKAADAIVRADPDAHVLVVCVELCTLHFQKSDRPVDWLANALFGDGAAAVLIQSRARIDQSFAVQSFYSDLLPEGRDEMAWTIRDWGFDMTLTAKVPAIIQRSIAVLLERLLNRNKLTISQVDYFALHPGGRRILEVIEAQLNIEPEKSRFAFEVLSRYGNMSSATILFVLKAIWNELADSQADVPNRPFHQISGIAFGPGLTIESMLLLAQIGQPERKQAPLADVRVDHLHLVES